MQRKDWYLLWVAAVAWAIVYGVLEVRHFGAPLWLDEVFSATVTAFPLADGWMDIRRDVHPPGYPILLIFVRWATGV